MNLMNFLKSLEFWEKFAAPIVALVIVFISNLVVLIKIRLDSKAAIKKELTLQSLNITKERLTKFYDPVIALLIINRDMFITFGPESFPNERSLKIEASTIWNNIIDDVILPNNKRVCEIVLQYSHLIDKSDNIENYLDFVKHANSYSIFRNKRNEIHKNFPYPSQLISKVSVARENVRQKLNSSEANLGKYIKEKPDECSLVKK